MPDADRLVTVDLNDSERYVLTRGLVEWGGPAHCTEAMAQAMGFGSVAALLREGAGLVAALDAKRPLSRRDWTRTLLATEIVFASNVLGSGIDWEATTGLDDAETLRTLRDVQYKLAGVVVRGGAGDPGPT